MQQTQRIFRHVLAALGFLLILPTWATHIVGGDLGYEFLGETAPGTNMFRYKLKVRIYLNCGASSNFPTIVDWLGSPDIPLRIGVYTQDPNNTNGSKIQYTIGNVFVTTWNIVTPDLPEDCVLGEGDCVEESLFEGEVILPLNAGGYHLYLQGFARNGAITNLVDPGNTGIGFYSFIPPSTIPNSSPVFQGTPVPFVCITDTTSFSNAAVDPDGDSLVFSFQVPYGSQDNLPGIVDPPLVLSWNIGPVLYQPGYSPAQPFGSTGYAYIDPQTGATEYSAGMLGNWVVAVEVNEYRSGQLIGRIRSDLQLLSVPCANNVAPEPQGGQLTASYTVNAGDTLCFPITFTDFNGDTLGISVNGSLFDPNVIFPAATLSGALTGDSLATATFCWATSCQQGRTDPYVFSVLAFDNACPPGLYNAAITVNVLPAAAPMQITGPGALCIGLGTYEYCAQGGPGTNYAWTVTGGNALSPLDQPCITVEWIANGIGELSVTSIDMDCIFTTVQPVNVALPTPATFIVETDTVCTGVRTTATNTSGTGTTAQWSYNGSSVQLNNGGSLVLPFNSAGTLELTITDQNGCTSSASQAFAVAPFSDVLDFRIPNVFSPNGDNVNDLFELISTQDLRDCYTITVFDRWGKEVFANTDNGLAWNGRRDGGQPASDGVYYYIIKLDEQTYSGHVSLMR